MKKWFIEISEIKKINGKYWIIPCISLWYDKYHFLETGVYSPAFGFNISFINYAWHCLIQKDY